MSKPLLVRSLTAGERKELARLIRRGLNAHVVRRAQMIRLSRQGHSATAIGTLWEISGQAETSSISKYGPPVTHDI